MKKSKPYKLFCVFFAAVVFTTACTAFCAGPDNTSDELESISGLPVDAKPADELPAIKVPKKDSPLVLPTVGPVKPVTPPAVKIPASKPVENQKKPANSPKPVETKKEINPASTKPALPSDIKPAAPQTEEQRLQSIILRLQMDNSRLMEEISKGQQANASITKALRESRMQASDLEAALRRKEIELTIKNEKAVLEQMKSAPSSQPAKTAQILQQENNILALQLRLARIDEPQRTKEMLETIGSVTRERDTLADKNKRIHTMLDEQIKKNEQSGEELKVIRSNLQSSEKEIARLRLEVKAYKEAMANPGGETRVEYVTNKPVATSPATANKSDKPADNGDTGQSAGDESAHKPVKIEINRIAGKITGIDDQIIKINVGSLHGLQAGIRLIVYRRDKFVGYLRVDIVGETTAAGAMSRQVYTPQIGDSVVDRL